MTASLGAFIRAHRERTPLIVQPRMGFGSLELMRSGLLAVKGARARVVGTITLDSYTRVNDYEGARRALETGVDLNGFPIVTHGAARTREMLAGVAEDFFPIQVRHGTALPQDVFRVILACGLTATEGGPISYCLPYSRLPLESAVAAWAECCELMAQGGAENHIESFGGCLLGQLCPPSLLVAVTILEGIFFKQRGLRSLSLSYTQGTHPTQDVAALRALRTLAEPLLKNVDWHIVFYTYMGVYPQNRDGANGLLEESARVAAQAGCERLIVKTPAETHRIPTIEENTEALERAYLAAASATETPIPEDPEEQSEILEQARMLIEAVLELDADLGRALVLAFKKGLLDVPYCLHQDNHNQTRAMIGSDGYLRWSALGNLPIEAPRTCAAPERGGSEGLLHMLNYNQRRYTD